MFQMFNNIFGTVNNGSSQEPEFCEKEDDEWLLVDIVVESHTKPPEEDAEVEDIPPFDESPPLLFTVGAFEPFESPSDSYFMHFCPPTMEESWFVTPPACFTARELTTTEVETSPMENLLIEHPSMSVYAVRNLHHKTIPASESLTSSSSESFKDSGKVGHQHIRCYVTARASRINCLEKTKMLQCSKLPRRQSEKRILNRKSLRRQNLIQGCPPRQIKHSRLLVHQPCKRRYNY
uniref:Tumor protein p53 inducible nuclear protein 1 n=1 Tax=Leptobrachium leishanense TaxID=445787 RepID=A0A8C5PMH6_9ANUR